MVILIKTFLNTYKELTMKLQHNKLTYQCDSQLGYYTDDIRYLGTGVTYLVEVANPENGNFDITVPLEREGFFFEVSDNVENITFGCNMNINIGTYRVLNVILDFFKALKVPLANKEK